MATEIVKVNIDWADAYGWQCPFCGAELDHLSDENNDEGTIDSSYTCQAQANEQSDMCGNSYMVVRYDPKQRGNNGDALTLERFIEIWVDERYINHKQTVSMLESLRDVYKWCGYEAEESRKQFLAITNGESQYKTVDSEYWRSRMGVMLEFQRVLENAFSSLKSGLGS